MRQRLQLVDHRLRHPDARRFCGRQLASRQRLRERLQASGLEVGELACRQGMPPRGPRTGLEQRWVDETA